MPKFKKAAVVGVGLIGASLAAALKKTAADIEIIGIDKDPKTIEKAENMGLIDQGFTEIADHLAEAEIIFLAVPVALIRELLVEIEAGSSNEQLIVDTGSTKLEIMEKAAAVFSESEKIFIGGHPMAGSHQSGIDWHQPDLFKNSPFILCPWLDEAEKKRENNELNPNSKKLKSLEAEMKLLEKQTALKKLRNLLTEIGSEVHLISAAEHDRCTAYLSHLPHLLASALVNLSSEDEFKKDFFAFVGSGYQDMTRIAASSADLWRDIIMTNKDNLAGLLKKQIAQLKKLQSKLENDQAAEIYNFLKEAAELKNEQLAVSNKEE